jgi:hypothetical protein
MQRIAPSAASLLPGGENVALSPIKRMIPVEIGTLHD